MQGRLIHVSVTQCKVTQSQSWYCLNCSGFAQEVNFKTNIFEIKSPCFHCMLSNAVPNKHTTKYLSNIKIYSWEATWCIHSGRMRCNAKPDRRQITNWRQFWLLSNCCQDGRDVRTAARNRQPIDRHRKTKAMTADQRFSHWLMQWKNWNASSSRPLHQL